MADLFEGAGEGVSDRNHCRLSRTAILLCFLGMGEIISDFSLSDLGDSSAVLDRWVLSPDGGYVDLHA